MTHHRWIRWFWGPALLLGLVIYAVFGGPTPPTQAVGREQLQRALLATVSIAVPIDGERDRYAGGSGSILTANGYILTNFHVVADKERTGEFFNRDKLAYIAVNPTNLRGLPVWTYRAEVVHFNKELDLAVLKVVAPFNGRGRLPDNLGLVTMPIGNSDEVAIGDEMSAIGFPALGGESVTFTQGTVSGFIDDDRDGIVEWFKTDTTINPGNSGGAAINANGELIGVPTRIKWETTGTGQFGLVRPINLAEPLIKAATADVNPNAEAQITNLVFTDRVDRRGRAIGTIANNFPEGTRVVYAVFDYEKFSDGAEFSAVWTLNGRPSATETYPWDGGEDGSWWVGIRNDNGLALGTYILTLSLGGTALREARVTVGEETPPAEPVFSNLVFSEEVDRNNNPIRPHGPDEPFVEGTMRVYATFDYNHMTDGLTFESNWYLDGEFLTGSEGGWTFGDSGRLYASLYNDHGLPNGGYRYEFVVEGKTVIEGQFAIGEDGRLNLPDEGVQVIGTILDADTGRPIRGATFIVLNPGVRAQDYLANQDETMILATGRADRNGEFVLSAPLARGQTYSAVVTAHLYQPLSQDDFQVATDEASPLRLTIRLRRR